MKRSIINNLKVISIALLSLVTSSLKSQEIIKLYPDQVPNSKTNSILESNSSGLIRGVTMPTLEVYLPEKKINTGAAVIICPGGSYTVLVYQGEGLLTARELAKNGIAAFVLKYRLPDDSTMIDKTIGPLQDVQQAIRIVRESATKWSINKNKIGIMGFSAGGHLASTGATHFQKSLIENPNNTSLRPDFQILVYPVISMQDSLTHPDSRTRLLGKNPSKELIENFSNELQVNDNTPIAYITHATDDKLVDVRNSINYYDQLHLHNVGAEMHLYQKGGHGFIFGHEGWMDPLLKWIKDYINN